MSDGTGAFDRCETVAEVIVLTNHMLGLDGVQKVLDQVGFTKESLIKAEREIARVGMTELAKTVKAAARRAKRGPPTFKSRWAHKKGH